MTITAMHHLADTIGRYAVICMCLGSGDGMVILTERGKPESGARTLRFKAWLCKAAAAGPPPCS